VEKPVALVSQGIRRGILYLSPVYQMTQAKLCRQKAIECEQEAKRTPSSFEVEAWLKLAKQWRDAKQFSWIFSKLQ
jgi:hypothetical protein